jgi:hypothetical protein
MTTLKDLRATAAELIEKHPQHRDEIVDFYHLAVSEVEEGGSEAHECSLAYNDMMSLVSGE